MATEEYKLSDYMKMNKIGEGTYGVVYRGRNLVTGRTVAMKKIRLETDEEGIPATAVREVSMLKELKHPNIVNMETVIMEENRLYLIFEFISMDFKRYIDTHFNRKPIDEPNIKFFTYQMIQGLVYCHQRRVVHRDLKPQNLLIDVESRVIKLADFGLARVVGLPVRAYTHEIVTLWYRSPEILLGAARYAFAVDMWSVGCIMAEMAMGKAIFQGDSEIDQIFRIFRVLKTPDENVWPGISSLPDFKPSFPCWTNDTLDEKINGAINPVGMEVLRGLLAYDPADRMSAKTAVNHRYFTEGFDIAALPCQNFTGKLET